MLLFNISHSHILLRICLMARTFKAAMGKVNPIHHCSYQNIALFTQYLCFSRQIVNQTTNNNPSTNVNYSLNVQIIFQILMYFRTGQKWDKFALKLPVIPMMLRAAKRSQTILLIFFSYFILFRFFIELLLQTDKSVKA